VPVEGICIDGDVDEAGAVIADRPVFGELDLAEDGDGADDQGERNGELGNDEDSARSVLRLCLL